MKLPRQAGQKEARFAHLLSGEPALEQLIEAPAERKARGGNDAERIASLEEAVQSLTQRVEDLTTQFDSFKKQFE
jgi:uncharacterized protein YceH (UPF0502 family)